MSGSGIVFAATRSPQGNGEPEIYTSDANLPDADQNNATQLTDNIATDDDPAWSPEGREIVFTSGRDGNFDIYVMNANGGDQRPLTRTPSTERSPAWGWQVGPPSTASSGGGSTVAVAPSTPIAPAQAGPRDTQIAFASDRDGDFDIYVMDGDGSNVRQATFNEAEDDAPTWSNDGRLIAWTSNAGGSFNLWVMNADGSDQRQITNHSANDRDPVWSPDGSQLAFTSDRDGDPEIWIVNADGGVAQQITNNGEALDLAPAWSPDGTRLLYYSDKSGGREIFLLDLASGSEIQLTSNNVYDGQPDWSLNGTQMVFAATRSPQGNGEPEIYISDASLLDANGDNATQLTDNPFLDDDPAWSPDGRQIVFESNRNGHLDIWIVNADGTGELQLTRDPSNDRSPDRIWKP
jgi:Tol biopolymer transport system component